jgi:hypothetical protein
MSRPLSSSGPRKSISGRRESLAPAANTSATVNANNQWMKGHPLEGDGIVNLYFYLWQKNNELKSCPLVQIPQTILFEHNFPRGWYYYDPKQQELKQRTGMDLDTKKIIAEFSVQESKNVEIVASYLSKGEDPRMLNDLMLTRSYRNGSNLCRIL